VSGILWTRPSLHAQMTAFGSALMQQTAAEPGSECVCGTDDDGTVAEPDESVAAVETL